jgi:hypothetical protein
MLAFPRSGVLCYYLALLDKVARKSDMILTPFFFSPTTDSASDFLPDLFLAYCTITDTM